VKALLIFNDLPYGTWDRTKTEMVQGIRRSTIIMAADKMLVC
jgi:hypothetical protein